MEWDEGWGANTTGSFHFGLLVRCPRFLDPLMGQSVEKHAFLGEVPKWLIPKKGVPWVVVRSSHPGTYLAKTRAIPARRQCVQNALPPQQGCHLWAPSTAPPASQWEDTGLSPDPHRLLRCSEAGPGQSRARTGLQWDEHSWELPRELTPNAAPSAQVSPQWSRPGWQHQLCAATGALKCGLCQVRRAESVKTHMISKTWYKNGKLSHQWFLYWLRLNDDLWYTRVKYVIQISPVFIF